MSSWEHVALDTIRLAVPGGWLYAVGFCTGGRESSLIVRHGPVFVPAPTAATGTLGARITSPTALSNAERTV